jgi:hypothetical protein
MISNRSYFCALFSLLVMGCASQTKKDVKPESSEPRSLAERLSESGGFELQRESPYFKGQIEKEVYQTGDYEKKSWWGKKEYQKAEYEGDTDGSRFKISAKDQGKPAYLGNKKVDTGDAYRTNTLDYGSARESDVDRIDKPRNDYAESRRRTYVQPSIMDWEEQRKLSLEQSRSILGR